jgi:signal peptidase II
MFFVLDRYLKFLSINLNESISLINNWLIFTFYPNKYISFSIPVEGVALNILLFFLIILVLINLFLLIKKDQKMEFLGWLAVFFGAISNFIDRMKFSYVIDYLDLKYFTVFNLADFLIFAGCLVIIFGSFKLNRKQKI